MIKVYVTKKDINEAEKTRDAVGDDNFNYYSFCPVAIALKRTQKKKVKVNCAREISINNKYYSAVTREYEKLVDRFIDAFDDGKKVKPISFIISR